MSVLCQLKFNQVLQQALASKMENKAAQTVLLQKKNLQAEVAKKLPVAACMPAGVQT